MTDINPTPTKINDHAITPRKIKFAMDKLNLCKAPGIDFLRVPILQEIPKKTLLMVLTYFFKAILRLRHFPKLWKIAKVVR